MDVILNPYGAWCLVAIASAFGLMFIVTFVVRMVGRLGGDAIDAPEEIADG